MQLCSYFKMKTKVVKRKACFPHIQFSGEICKGEIHYDGYGYYNPHKFNDFKGRQDGNIDIWIEDVKTTIKTNEQLLKDLKKLKEKIYTE